MVVVVRLLFWGAVFEAGGLWPDRWKLMWVSVKRKLLAVCRLGLALDELETDGQIEPD